MLKKEIKFKDLFNGEEVVEEWHFHLTRSELIELEAHFGGGIEAGIRRIIAAEDNETLVQEFKRLIMLTVGKRAGRNFDKSEEVKREFASSPAFDEMFMSLVEDEKAAAAFINGIMPEGMTADTTATEAKQQMEQVAATKTLPNLAEEAAAQKAGSPVPPTA